MFHVLSLQRTASKSLVLALDTVLDTNKKLQLAGEPLAEFLHYWTQTDFSFNHNMTRPFGHDEDVVYYKTHPKFNDARNIQFEYLLVDNTFEYTRSSNRLLVPQAYFEALALLQTANPIEREFVLKTQLAYMLQSCSSTERQHLHTAVQEFNTNNKVTTIHLARKDKLSWLCSMALTDASGVFIPSKAQQKAIEKFQTSPIEVDFKSKLIPWADTWNKHVELSDKADVRLLDSSLTKDIKLVNKRTKTDILIPAGSVPFVKEFGQVDYSSMIFNYDELYFVANELMTEV